MQHRDAKSRYKNEQNLVQFEIMPPNLASYANYDLHYMITNPNTKLKHIISYLMKHLVK